MSMWDSMYDTREHIDRARELYDRAGLVPADEDRKVHDEDPTVMTIRRHLRPLPARYLAADFGRLDDAQRPDILRAWLADDDAQTLWIAGGVGSGKTYAAAAVTNEYAIDRLRATLRGPVTGWWSVAGLLDALRQDPDGPAWDRAHSAGLIVLDDFGYAKPTDWAVERLWLLIDHRVSRGLRQVCTTNARLTALEETWGPAIVDRLSDNRWSLTITGASRRKPAADFTSDSPAPTVAAR